MNRSSGDRSPKEMLAGLQHHRRLKRNQGLDISRQLAQQLSEFRRIIKEKQFAYQGNIFSSSLATGQGMKSVKRGEKYYFARDLSTASLNPSGSFNRKYRAPQGASTGSEVSERLTKAEKISAFKNLFENLCNYYGSDGERKTKCNEALMGLTRTYEILNS